MCFCRRIIMIIILATFFSSPGLFFGNFSSFFPVVLLSVLLHIFLSLLVLVFKKHVVGHFGHFSSPAYLDIVVYI